MTLNKPVINTIIIIAVIINIAGICVGESCFLFFFSLHHYFGQSKYLTSSI